MFVIVAAVWGSTLGHPVFLVTASLVCLIRCRWQIIQGSLANHRAKLTAALEIHAFNRDVDDVNDRINEKVSNLVSRL